MNYDNPLGAKYRVVEDVEHDGQPARIVSCSRTFDTYPEDLWDALTDASRIPRWFLPITGDLKLGGKYQLEGNAGGTIIRCDPNEVLEITWEHGGNVSWVTVRLEPDDDETRMTLEHKMLKDEASEAHWKQYGPGATGVGWDLGFLAMGIHLDSGEALDQKETYTWMASEPGKTFIRQCATAWGKAHIKSGEDASIANEMAEQTAKAYTGEQ